MCHSDFCFEITDKHSLSFEYVSLDIQIHYSCCLLTFLQLGGLNSMLAVEHSPSIPLVSKVPTIIIGMDVSHGSPGQSDVPSIAAVTCVLLPVVFLRSLLPNSSFFFCLRYF